MCFSLSRASLRKRDGEETREREIAAMQWCGAMTRRIMMTQRTSAALTSSAKYSSLSPASAAPAASEMDMCGRGDKKTKKGKRFKGSYGNSRGKKQKMIERIKDKLEVPRSTPWPLPFKLI